MFKQQQFCIPKLLLRPLQNKNWLAMLLYIQIENQTNACQEFSGGGSSLPDTSILADLLTAHPQ